MMRKTLLLSAALTISAASFGQQKTDAAEYSPYILAVDEYVPAPGQFINTLPQYEKGDDAAAMAQKCTDALAGNAGGMVSLGAYGGYITFHFDHSVANIAGQADLYIKGNAFSGSGEPGIVMVSKDINHNGIADDPWYELAGSAGSECPDKVVYGYQISYTLAPMESSPWTDNQGGSGTIDRNSFHSQEYFPLWMESPLVFNGTLLPKNGTNTGEDSEYWVLSSLAYGYVDNQPNSNIEANSFDIEWAVDKNRQSVNLDFIDFVRVYTAVNQMAGWLGETSTEVTGAEDLHLEASLQAIDTALSTLTFEDAEAELDETGVYKGQDEEEYFEYKGLYFNNHYFEDWNYWSGFALVSNHTSTSFSMNNYADDQFNVCTGGGYDQSTHYVIAYPQGESIDTKDPEGMSLSGFYVTNTAWTLDAILHGDGMSGVDSNGNAYTGTDGFRQGDYLKVTVTGISPEGDEKETEFYLADYRSNLDTEHYYLGNWQWVDLSCLGQIVSISFTFDSSRRNNYGITSPTYFAFDNLNGNNDGRDGRIFAVTDGISKHTGTHRHVTETGRYSADGSRLGTPVKGLNIIRYSDGTTRKVFIR